MSAAVSVVPCPDYTEISCQKALEQVLAPLGGLAWVKPGMRVVIKANLVAALAPETAATTHPMLLRVLTKQLLAQGAQVVVGDSPGGLYTAPFVEHIYKATGMDQVEAAGAKLNRDFSQAEAVFPEAMVAKQFTYTRYLQDADIIVNFCKLKSHGMMGMSAATKNMFGAIPGTRKPEYHFRYPNARDFARMLVDLNDYFKPALCLTDAVVAMEGNGPTQGNPRFVGALLASRSPHTLDLACAYMLGMARSHVPTLEAALERALIPPRVEDLAVFGDLSALRVPDFQKLEAPSSLLFRGRGDGPLARLQGSFIQKALCAEPRVQASICIGCGKCAAICPAKAIVLQDRLPKIRKSACIHCFCCQEFCPAGAMRVHRTAIARLLSR